MVYVYAITEDIMMNISNGQSEGNASIFTILDDLQVIYSLLTYLISKS